VIQKFLKQSIRTMWVKHIPVLNSVRKRSAAVVGGENSDLARLRLKEQPLLSLSVPPFSAGRPVIPPRQDLNWC
jgi:hypothetical protein